MHGDQLNKGDGEGMFCLAGLNVRKTHSRVMKRLQYVVFMYPLYIICGLKHFLNNSIRIAAYRHNTKGGEQLKK